LALLPILTQNSRACAPVELPAEEPGSIQSGTAATLFGMTFSVCSKRLTFDSVNA
jgi:hypothetical protein